MGLGVGMGGVSFVGVEMRKIGSVSLVGIGIEGIESDTLFWGLVNKSTRNCKKVFTVIKAVEYNKLKMTVGKGRYLRQIKWSK